MKLFYSIRLQITRRLQDTTNDLLCVAVYLPLFIKGGPRSVSHPWCLMVTKILTGYSQGLVAMKDDTIIDIPGYCERCGPCVVCG